MVTIGSGVHGIYSSRKDDINVTLRLVETYNLKYILNFLKKNEVYLCFKILLQRGHHLKLHVQSVKNKKKKKKKNTTVYFNTNYCTKMKLVPVIMDYCLL